jgi:hypothetical protein
LGLVHFYQHHIQDSGRQPAFLLLLAFLITFLLTRLYTRLARTRSWGSGHAGDIHVHHMVVGIVFALLAGFLDFALDPRGPWLEILAVVFGIGAALTLDEFALWLYLKDVYWAHEGRNSIDAVIFAVLLGALVCLGSAPLGLNGHSSIEGLVLWGIVNFTASLIAFFKGKLFLGLAGLFIPLLGWIAAIRLARPNSPWARRFYRSDKKMARAMAREQKRIARKTRVRDLIGGAPSELKTPHG